MVERGHCECESVRSPDQTDTAAQSSDTVVHLTDRQKLLLIELVDIEAIGFRQKTTRDAVAKRFGQSKTGDDLGRDFAALSKYKFTDSQPGPNGGIWLTSKGKAEAKLLRDESSQS